MINVRLLIFAGIVTMGSACNKPELPSAASAPSPQAQLEHPVATQATEEDCQTGLTKYQGGTIDCGTWIEDPKGTIVGGYNASEETTFLHIGNHEYRVTVTDGVWSGQNFKLTFVRRKSIDPCIDGNGKRITECEHTEVVADIVFECAGRKASGTGWKIKEGC